MISIQKYTMNNDNLLSIEHETNEKIRRAHAIVKFKTKAIS
jgi:hypothetical protein